MIKRLFVLAILVAMLASCGNPATATPVPAMENTHGLKIVASTSWVGSFALAAGAEDISIIAPSTIQHPPDYDPKPSDLEAISGADYVLYAGFEGFAARMQEAVGSDSSKLITVATENSPEAIHKEVTRLGELFGTQDKATAFLATFDAKYASLSDEVKASVGDQKPVVVNQLFVTPWVFFAGLESAGSYGPMPMTPDELKTLSDAKPTMIFENYHMGGGAPLVEATGATKIDLINFPGDDMNLLAIFETNAKTLEEAFAAQAAMAPTQTESADPFKLSVAQHVMDSAGFHEIATALSETKTIDPEYFSVVTSVKKVLIQTTWPAELNDQAKAFIESLDAFATALEADNATDAVTLSDTVHEAQHELSHAIEHWLGDAQPIATEASSFDISVAQHIMDGAGFHEIATALSETQTIDPEYFSTITGVSSVLSHTVWPSELNDQAQAFIESLGAFAAALEADNAADAVTLSDTVHEAQHEFSHAIEHWLGDAPMSMTEANGFDVSVAQYVMDAAGFHEIAAALSETQTIDPEYFSTVTGVNTVLAQTMWPSELNDEAQAFIKSLGSFATALEADNIADAVAISETVHDAQHELSHSIDHFMEGHAH